MQLHNRRSPPRGLALALLLAMGLLGARPAHAYREVKVGFMGDFVQGVSIPIADGNYKRFANPSYKLGLRLGAVFYINRMLGVAPEGEFDYSPVNTNDSTYKDNHLQANFNRVRGLVGGRLIVPFGIGSFYVRVMFGVDYLTGSVGVLDAIAVNYSSTGFTFEPGFGVQFNVYKHLVVGLTTGFPIAAHDTGTNRPILLLNNNSFTAVDLDFLAVVGLRL